MAKKLLFIVAHEGYHPVEYGVPRKILEDEGFEITVASNNPGAAIAKDGSTTDVDVVLEKVDPVFYDAVVVIGGPGTMENLDNDACYSVIQKANMAGKVLAGICHATRVLAKAGALVTKNATGWDGDGKLKEIYDEHGAIYDDSPVLTDGLVVTAIGPDQSEDFANAIKALV